MQGSDRAAVAARFEIGLSRVEFEFRVQILSSFEFKFEFRVQVRVSSFEYRRWCRFHLHQRGDDRANVLGPLAREIAQQVDRRRDLARLDGAVVGEIADA